MTCDTGNLTFDISGTAALYSQLTGVLAAFAFGAITFILPGTHRRLRSDKLTGRDQDPTDMHVLLALVAAFMSLIISTIQYAVLAGERGCSLVAGRAASEEFLGGMAFAFSVLLLLYAVVQLVAHSGIDRIGFHARLIVTVLGPPLAILFLITSALDVAYTPWQLGEDGSYTPQDDSPFIHSLESISLLLPGVIFVLCVLAWLAGRRRRTTKRRAGLSTLPLVVFPYLALLLATTAVVRSTTLAVADPFARVQQWEVWTWLAACSVVLLLQAVLLSFELGVDDPSDSVPNDVADKGEAPAPEPLPMRLPAVERPQPSG